MRQNEADKTLLQAPSMQGRTPEPVQGVHRCSEKAVLLQVQNVTGCMGCDAVPGP